jgi:hypothetical protein
MGTVHYTCMEDERVKALEVGGGEWESSSDDDDEEDDPQLCSESEGVMSGVESDAEERSLTSLVTAKVLCMYM